MRGKRSAQPSRAVTVGTISGATLTPVVLYVLHALGAPLPDDPAQAAALGSSIGGLIVGALAWFTRGGRIGEPH
jgi:hypothetical protein